LQARLVSIAVRYKYESGSTLQFEGVVYHLEQFHFHTLSEHTVRGQYGAMELHAVFKDDLVNTTKIAVVGVRYTIGRANPFLSALLAHGLPAKTGEHIEDADAINLGFEEQRAENVRLGSNKQLIDMHLHVKTRA
jgi:carbonic anhydrase